jgi:hypothetical protein
VGDCGLGVTHSGGTESPSQNLQFSIASLSPAQLPTPQVTEAPAAVLDLNTFQGNAHLTVAAWPVAAPGQRVWLTVSGPGGVPSLNILEGYPILTSEAEGGITRDIPRSELEKYADGSQMTVVFKATFDGSDSESTAIGFPILNLTVKNVEALLLEEFDSTPIQFIYEKTENIQCPTMAISLMGDVPADNTNTHYISLGIERTVPNQGNLKVLALRSSYLSGNSTARTTLKSVYTSVEIAVWNQTDQHPRSLLTVTAYDENGVRIGEDIVPASLYFQPYKLPFSNVKYMDFTISKIVMNQVFLIDKFIFTK